MGLFVTSTSSVTRHGVFAIEVPPPAMVAASGTSDACIVGQFAWGPTGEVYEPTSMGDLFDKFSPRGMSRTTTGHLAVIRKGWPKLKVIRAIGTTAAKASATINKTGPTALVVITLKYHGTAGNSVVITIGAATDGDANHFDITATVTGASGTTTDIIRNVNVSGTGDDVLPTQAQLDQLKLIGSVTKSSAGVPILGNTTCSGGVTGTIDATAYIGTEGDPEIGLSLAETDLTIRHVFADDCGDSARDAVNAGLVAHAALMGDRIAYINGNSGLSVADVQTDKASYSSVYALYADNWAYVFDDTDGTERLTPPGAWAASVASQLSPSTSIAWKAGTVRDMLAGISRLETNRGNALGTLTSKGICSLTKGRKGGHVFEAGVMTIADADPSKKNLTRIRIGQYIASSVTDSLNDLVDAPNVPVNQQDGVNAVDDFLSTLKRNQNRNPNFTPHIKDFVMPELSSVNTDETLDAGEFHIPADIKTSSGMEKIFLSMRFGETVKISAS